MGWQKHMKYHKSHPLYAGLPEALNPENFPRPGSKPEDKKGAAAAPPQLGGGGGAAKPIQAVQATISPPPGTQAAGQQPIQVAQVQVIGANVFQQNFGTAMQNFGQAQGNIQVAAAQVGSGRQNMAHGAQFVGQAQIVGQDTGSGGGKGFGKGAAMMKRQGSFGGGAVPINGGHTYYAHVMENSSRMRVGQAHVTGGEVAVVAAAGVMIAGSQMPEGNMGCKYCGRTNHKSDDCYMKKKHTCTYCGMQGHHEDECPQKPGATPQNSTGSTGPCEWCGLTNHTSAECKYKGMPKCEHCGRRNHTSDMCRFKPRE